ncbi:hypothetical protein BO83DRAFT_437669 [Aspergillus eucalypticola CBS 122712]|uniref:DNA-directed RNA polymerase subunit n=1 Tax=Aspergillus eucalypticola (strain CBS 122712 / IBT 29274) TaxID=1448314 RepID=A0A317VHV9_ASPEC|nr:uncharacterized protein BO83DRAFT_437669 [Aspergillus eucalypticola CBS 122712]PWY72757.1 hypothetical protein BO83DRAFT_437669 [Aspergillus eucalypticola CBS 122712]
MVVQFCDDCGNLLDESSDDTLKCGICGKTAKNMAIHHVQVSTSENFPSRLRHRLKSNTQEVTYKTIGKGPSIDMECVKCPSREVTYAQVQLRSADEGSTIFYTCAKCGHRWQEDN